MRQQASIHISGIRQQVETLGVLPIHGVVLLADRHSSEGVARGARRSRPRLELQREERALTVPGVVDVGLDRRRPAQVGVRTNRVVRQHLVDPFRAEDAEARPGVDDCRLGAGRRGTGIACVGGREGGSAATRFSSASFGAHAEARGSRKGGRSLLRLESVQEQLQGDIRHEQTFVASKTDLRGTRCARGDATTVGPDLIVGVDDRPWATEHELVDLADAGKGEVAEDPVVDIFRHLHRPGAGRGRRS